MNEQLLISVSQHFLAGNYQQVIADIVASEDPFLHNLVCLARMLSAKEVTLEERRRCNDLTSFAINTGKPKHLFKSAVQLIFFNYLSMNQLHLAMRAATYNRAMQKGDTPLRLTLQSNDETIEVILRSLYSTAPWVLSEVDEGMRGISWMDDLKIMINKFVTQVAKVDNHPAYRMEQGRDLIALFNEQEALAKQLPNAYFPLQFIVCFTTLLNYSLCDGVGDTQLLHDFDQQLKQFFNSIAAFVYESRMEYEVLLAEEEPSAVYLPGQAGEVILAMLSQILNECERLCTRQESEMLTRLLGEIKKYKTQFKYRPIADRVTKTDMELQRQLGMLFCAHAEYDLATPMQQIKYLLLLQQESRDLIKDARARDLKSRFQEPIAAHVSSVPTEILDTLQRLSLRTLRENYQSSQFIKFLAKQIPGEVSFVTALDSLVFRATATPDDLKKANHYTARLVHLVNSPEAIIDVVGRKEVDITELKSRFSCRSLRAQITTWLSEIDQSGLNASIEALYQKSARHSRLFPNQLSYADFISGLRLSMTALSSRDHYTYKAIYLLVCQVLDYQFLQSNIEQLESCDPDLVAKANYVIANPEGVLAAPEVQLDEDWGSVSWNIRRRTALDQLFQHRSSRESAKAVASPAPWVANWYNNRPYGAEGNVPLRAFGYFKTYEKIESAMHVGSARNQEAVAIRRRETAEAAHARLLEVHARDTIPEKMVNRLSELNIALDTCSTHCVLGEESGDSLLNFFRTSGFTFARVHTSDEQRTTTSLPREFKDPLIHEFKTTLNEFAQTVSELATFYIWTIDLTEDAKTFADRCHYVYEPATAQLKNYVPLDELAKRTNPNTVHLFLSRGEHTTYLRVLSQEVLINREANSFSLN